MKDSKSKSIQTIEVTDIRAQDRNWKWGTDHDTKTKIKWGGMTYIK